MQMPPSGYVMMRMFWREFIQKFPLFSKSRLPQLLKQKYFQILICYFLKSHLFFDLRFPKKLVITVRNLRIGHWLEIWWSGSKDLFSQFGWGKRWHVSKPFSGKMNSLKIKHLKKIHFFLVSENDNLTSIKTHHDRLKNLGKETLEYKV